MYIIIHSKIVQPRSFGDQSKIFQVFALYVRVFFFLVSRDSSSCFQIFLKRTRACIKVLTRDILTRIQRIAGRGVIKKKRIDTFAPSE